MAKYILRPSQDITVNHTKYPEDSSSAYVLINEEVPDDSATYIFLAMIADEEETWKCSSSFVFSTVLPPSKGRLKKAKIIIKEGIRTLTGANAENYRVIASIKIGSETKDFFINTRESEIGEEVGLFTQSADITDFVIKNPFLSSCEVTLTQRCDSVKEVESGYKTYDQVVRLITTAWIELEFQDSIGVHEKNNGTYKAATTAYKKIDGAWTEISEDECKEILKNNDIRRG